MLLYITDMELGSLVSWDCGEDQQGGNSVVR